MRMTFIDEGGTSQSEPFYVVGAIIIGGDEVYVAVEAALDKIVREHIPEEHQEGFVFHATHIFSGAVDARPSIRSVLRRH